VHLGEPIERGAAPAPALLERARDEIERTLARWRGAPA
jgi:hypothetical protein